MKVQIFIGVCASELQKKINKWLYKEKPSIRFITQSEDGKVSGDSCLTICIWYEEQK